MWGEKTIIATVIAAIYLAVVLPLTALIAVSPPQNAPTNAMANTVVKLVPSKATVQPGENFSIDVVIEPAAGANVAGAQFDLTFNPQSVHVNSVAEGNFLNQGGNPTFFNTGTIDNTNGKLSAVFGAIIKAGATAPNAGIFATIQCTGVKAPTTSSFVLSNVIVGSKDGVAVPLESLTPAQVVVALSADVNLDGVINVDDIVAVAGVFGTSGAPGFTRADVNGDGTVNILDVILVGQNFA